MVSGVDMTIVSSNFVSTTMSSTIDVDIKDEANHAKNDFESEYEI
jgi:hypothetical protein